MAYARWASARAEPVLAEKKILTWLTQRGATVHTGALSQVTMVAGVRLTE